MKVMLSAILLLISSNLAALEAQPGILDSTLKEVQSAERKFHLPMKIWLGFLPGNGVSDPLHNGKKRSTLIFHHENSSSDKHYIIVWFHGMGGYHKFSQNMFPQLKELIRRGKSFTLIEPELPWSCNVSSIDGRTSWAKPDSFVKFISSAMQVFHSPPGMKTSLVVAGHSRGGKAIRDALTFGGLCEMKPDLVLWSDATYSNWFHKSWHACLRGIADKVEILYIKHTETERQLKKTKEDRMNLVHVKSLGLPWYHGKVGDNALLLSDFLK